MSKNNSISLKPHQVYPIEFIKYNFGLILFHSTGSGKTITSLIATTQFPKVRTVIISPKSSKKAFNDEIEKLGLKKHYFKMYTYQKIKRIMYDNVEMFKDKFVIVDEAHHLRSPTKDNMFLSSLLQYSFKIFLLTATPVVNYLNDISPLVNIIKKRNVLPEERELFNFFYFDEAALEIKNEHLLKDKLKDCISYYKMIDDKNYPKSETVEKRVVMSRPQLEQYIKFVKKLIYDKDAPNQHEYLLSINFEMLNVRKKNAFLTATRQLSNTYFPMKFEGFEKTIKEKFAPKIIDIVDTLEKNPLPAIVYSNFLENGVYTVANLLNERGITFKMITGSTTEAKVNIIVNEYNKRKFDVLLLSSAGSESLDLKNTRQIHIVEPHWNEARIRQVIGRAIRYKSHNDLPVEERNVKIFRWISVFPKPYFNMSADEYLVYLSKEKDKIFEEFKSIIIESSIEKTKNIDRNIKRFTIGKKTFDVNEFGFKNPSRYNKYKEKYERIKNEYLEMKYKF